MILEIATLDIKPNQTTAFEAAFTRAQRIISASPGYIKHSLSRCHEQPNRYALLVEWQTLEANTVGFRQSPAYLEWKALLHHFYDPFPTVEHFEEVKL